MDSGAAASERERGATVGPSQLCIIFTVGLWGLGRSEFFLRSRLLCRACVSSAPSYLIGLIVLGVFCVLKNRMT